jgi:Mn2+/Fe2+ NRAMP family transporter
MHILHFAITYQFEVVLSALGVVTCLEYLKEVLLLSMILLGILLEQILFSFFFFWKTKKMLRMLLYQYPYSIPKQQKKNKKKDRWGRYNAEISAIAQIAISVPFSY